MVFGILEDRKLAKVPGTGLLSDHGRACSVTTEEGWDLKRRTGRYSDIILIPQPSDDPCDPLNWLRWRKEACFWMLAFTTSLACALFQIATSGYVLLAKQFGVSVDNVASSFSSYHPALAVSMLLQSTFAVKYGHRIVYLVSAFLMFITCCWTALSSHLGFGMAVSQASSFSVHERGSRSIIWNFGLTAAQTLSPFIYGYVIQNLSWQLGFWFTSVACGLTFIGTFFFVPETKFHRQAFATFLSSKSHQGGRTSTKDYTVAIKKVMMPQPREALEKHVDHSTGSLHVKPPLFFSQLRIYNSTFSDESLWQIFKHPFPLVLSPIGLTHLGGFVGVILGMLITGPLSDWAIVWMSQRNRGVFEPEYRLVFMLSTLVGVFGYVGWAIGSDNHMPWIGAVACFAMVTFSLIISSGAALTYLLDMHGANALHILSITNFAKNLILYGITFVTNSLIATCGVKVALLILAACQTVSLLTSIPMYVYGKHVRSLIARHPCLFGREGLPASDFLQSAAAPQTGPKHGMRVAGEWARSPGPRCTNFDFHVFIL
ncbi:hypothetical protein V8D89_011050 [Ganoderma adspersum]